MRPTTTAHPLRRINAVALAILSLTGLASGVAQSGSNEETAVVLPPMIVDQAQRPIRWNYVSLNDFEMLTNAPIESAREFARNYHRQEELLRALIPGKYLWHTSVPAMHIMVEGRAAERLTDEALGEFFAGSRPNGNNNRRQRNPEFLPNLRLEDNDSSIVFIRREAGRAPSRFDSRDFFGFRSDTENRFQFTAGRIAFLLSRRTPKLPPWFVAGLVGVYADSDFEEGAVNIDSAQWSTPREADMLRRNPLRPREVAPLRRLFGSPPPPGQTERLKVWQEQCTLFVRWAMFADDGAHRQALWRFVDWIEGSPVDENAFEQCFGLDYVTARDAVSDYLPEAIQDHFVIKPAQISPPGAIVARSADSTEVARIRAEWERLEVSFVAKQYPDLAPAYLRHARNNLAAAQRAIGSSADLMVASGLLEFDAGNYVEAGQKLETALALGATRPRAAYALARIRFDAARARGPLSAADAGSVLAPLQVARRHAPALPEVFALMGDLWLNTEMKPLAPDLEALEEGVRRFPADPAIIGRVALVYAQNGEVGQAVSLLHLSMAQAHNDATKELLRRLLAQLGGLGRSS